MPDLGQLDQGMPFPAMRVWLGPTLGWVQEVVRPEKFYSISPVMLGPKDSVVLLRNPGMFVILPDVVAWVKEPAYNPYTSFERSLWVKDLSGVVSQAPSLIAVFGSVPPGSATFSFFGNPYLTVLNFGPPIHTVAPSLTQSIDGQPSILLNVNYGMTRLYPKTDLTGWYNG